MNPLKVINAGLVPYELAYEWQIDLHRRRVEDKIPDLLLLLEHPHVFTLGRRFSKDHLLFDDKALETRGIEVHEADRGGSITYHGPGQIVGYPVIDLRRNHGHPSEQPDAIRYLRQLEEAIIRTVRAYGVIAARREGYTGVWVGDGKLAAIGVNVSRGVTKHGFALNVSTDLQYFGGMIPCGIPGVRMTSLAEILGAAPAAEEVAQAIGVNLAKVLYRIPITGDLHSLDLAHPSEQQAGTDDVSVSAVVDFPIGRRPGAAPNRSRAQPTGKRRQ